MAPQKALARLRRFPPPPRRRAPSGDNASTRLRGVPLQRGCLPSDATHRGRYMPSDLELPEGDTELRLRRRLNEMVVVTGGTGPSTSRVGVCRPEVGRRRIPVSGKRVDQELRYAVILATRCVPVLERAQDVAAMVVAERRKLISPVVERLRRDRNERRMTVFSRAASDVHAVHPPPCSAPHGAERNSGGDVSPGPDAVAPVRSQEWQHPLELNDASGATAQCRSRPRSLWAPRRHRVPGARETHRRPPMSSPS